jgi:MoaA/NifB/PqqE/SkfB family radical SAM enzyme
VRGVQRCREAGILTGISTFATKEKILSGELHRMMDLAKALDVLEVFVFDVTPTGRLSGHDECVLTDDETEHLRELRTYYAEKPDYPPIIQQTMFSSTAYPCVAGGCPAGMVQMHLRANGDVSPCDFTPCSFGNVRRSSLREIWQAITASNLYAEPSQRCRLASSKFRSKLLEVAPVS